MKNKNKTPWFKINNYLLLYALILSASVLESTLAVDFSGLWSAHRDYGPEIHGELELTNSNGTWTAEISGVTTLVKIEGSSLSFELPNDLGSFKGIFEGARNEINGHWIQPRAVSMSFNFASPVKLNFVAEGRWIGIVKPMHDRMQFYLKLQSNADGSTSGFIRNPQLNFGRFFKIKNVLLKENELTLVEEGREFSRLTGIYNSDYDLFSILIPDAGGTFDFRKAENQSYLFYPRHKDNLPYSYKEPLEKKDGWQVASLTEVGMDKKVISELVNDIIEVSIDSINAPYIHALIIARNGKLVVEEYFHGYSGDVPHDTRSASKSVTSTMVGAAIQYSKEVALDSRVYEVMLDGSMPNSIDARKKQITLEHLLTMTAGFDCDDRNYESPGNEDIMQNQDKQPDWTQYILDLPQIHDPGTFASYCSASPNLALAMICKQTSNWAPELFRKTLAEPMQFGLYHMNLTPVGEGYGGGGLRILPRDFLKFGQIMLDNGKWNNRQILSDEWCQNAIKPHSTMRGSEYGYGWWLIEYPYHDKTVKAFYAGGNGGQYIIGIPELEVVVVFYGANYNQTILHRPKLTYVPEFIIRSIESAEE